MCGNFIICHPPLSFPSFPFPSPTPPENVMQLIKKFLTKSFTPSSSFVPLWMRTHTHTGTHSETERLEAILNKYFHRIQVYCYKYTPDCAVRCCDALRCAVLCVCVQVERGTETFAWSLVQDWCSKAKFINLIKSLCAPRWRYDDLHEHNLVFGSSTDVSSIVLGLARIRNNSNDSDAGVRGTTTMVSPEYDDDDDDALCS